MGEVEVHVVSQAQSEIDALLRQRHRIGPGQEAGFTMRSQEEIASTQMSRTLSILLGSAAALSIVGGTIGGRWGSSFRAWFRGSPACPRR